MFRFILCTGCTLIILLVSFAAVIPAWADDPPGITTTVNITGTNPDAHVNLYGDNPDVWINGNGLGALSYYGGYFGGAAAASMASQFNSPNNQYSQSSTGFLPLPTITADGKVAQVGSAGTQWVEGWKGYFCPDSNEDIRVYKGAGCGGTWGVCDGYPDLWVRRQIAGLAPEFRQQQAKLDTSIVAISRLIMETKQNGTDLQLTNAALEQNLGQLAEVSVQLAILEGKFNDLEKAVALQKEESDRRLTFIFTIFCIGLLAMAGYMISTIFFDKPRRTSPEDKVAVKKPCLVIRNLGR